MLEIMFNFYNIYSKTLKLWKQTLIKIKSNLLKNYNIDLKNKICENN